MFISQVFTSHDEKSWTLASRIALALPNRRKPRNASPMALSDALSIHRMQSPITLNIYVLFTDTLHPRGRQGALMLSRLD